MMSATKFLKAYHFKGTAFYLIHIFNWIQLMILKSDTESGNQTKWVDWLRFYAPMMLLSLQERILLLLVELNLGCNKL